MTKRIVSIVLCLIMALSVVAPVAQASDVNLSYGLDGIFDNVIVGDNVQLDNVVIDGNTVGNGVRPGGTPGWEMPAMPIPTDVCKCDECPTVADHSIGCIVKAELNKLCAGTAEDLFAQWADFAADEKAYMLQYMQENYSGRFADFQKLLNAPTGFDSETFKDGTTVSVQGIPEDGSLTIKEATDEVKEIVEKYAEKNSSSAVEVFNFDISVQDGKGADWQPETSVKMELDVPGAKLHKYAKVYVVHVDDNGVASTIEASVTEDGKIAFETPGFSTFAGFTVDFEYNGEKFSINGLTTIKLSEVFDTLKMPLYVEDVANVTFTDTSLVTVEKQTDGDWLLTSLKAFQTTETLTVTMNDGAVYAIKVTDAITTEANFYVAYYGGDPYWYIDGYSVSGGNSVVQLFLDSDGYPQSNDDGVYDCGYFDTQPLVIDGRGVGGCMEIVLQKETGAGDNLVWDLVELKIKGGAKVVIRLGDSFTGTETITINSVRPYTNAARPMFNIEDGSLYFNLSDDEASLCTGTGMTVVSESSVKQIIFDGNDLGASASVPLIYTHRGIDETDRQNLVVSGVTFRDAKHRAVLVQTNNMNNLRFTNCTFESTVRDVQYGGGAIYIDGGTDGSTSYVVDVKNFILTNCTFDGNTGASGHGGAIASYGDISKLDIDGCTFKNCTSANRGGAIELSVNDKTKDNNVIDWIRFKDTTFTSCTASSHGGAIDISNGDNPLHLAAGLTITGCTFTNCKATKNRGGAIRMVVGPIVRNLTITDSGFSGCTAGSVGGAVSVQGTIGNIFISGGKKENGELYTFKNCQSDTMKETPTNNTQHAGAFAVDTSSACGNVTISGAAFIGNTATARGGGFAILCPGVGDISITDSDFKNNTAGTHCGAFLVNCENSYCGNVTISGSTFSGNSCGARGGAVLIYCPQIGNITISTSTFTDNTAETLGGGVHVGIPSDSALTGTTVGDVTVSNSTFTNNRAEGGVGGALSLTDGTYNSITVQDSSFTNCYSTNFGGAIGMKVFAADYEDGRKVFTVTNRVKIIDCSFDNCTSGNLNAEDYNQNGVLDDLWDHDGNPDTAQIQRLNGTGGGGAICLGGEIGLSLTAAQIANEAAIVIKSTKAAATDTDETNYSKFTNCYTWNNGGAIFFYETLRTPKVELQYLDFNGCRARDAGNAIHLSSCIVNNLAMTSCTVRNCSYFDPNDTTFTIDIPSANASLGKNTYYAYDAGGTFRCIGMSTCRAVISSCKFTGNKSYDNGGGVYWNANNSRTGVGAGVTETIDPSLQLVNTHFDNNYATRDGGAVYVEATVVVNGCSFKYNTAAGRGGAIAQQVYNSNAYDLKEGDATNLMLDPYTWMRNNTATDGGGISIRVNATQSIKQTDTTTGHSITFKLNGAAVYQNTATNCGGGICFVTESYADPNGWEQKQVDRFVKTIDIDGGTVTADDGTTSTQPGAIFKNTAELHGGGIYLESSQNTTLNISNANVSGNHADRNAEGVGDGVGSGGGIYMTGKNATCKITGGIVGGEGKDSAGIPLSNTAICGGGIAISGGATINMTGGEISYNNVGTVTANKHQGGGIWLDNKADDGVANSMTLSGGTVKNNSTPGGTGSDGGGIFVGEYGSFTITNGYVQNNTSNSWGGGLYASPNATVLVSGGEISGNTTVGSGGGIYALEATVTVSEGAVKDNRAVYGGGIYASKSTINITNSVATVGTGGSISGNIATSRGGGIGAYSGSIVTVSGGSIEGNWSFKGAGLYVNAASLTVNGGYISENGLAVKDGDTQYARTDMGGGIYGSGNAIVTVKGGNVYKNEANDGGGIWVEDPSSSLSIYGGEIRENTATDAGGGIGVSDAATALVSSSEDGKTHGTISKNVASRGGGVYVANGADLTVTNGYITYNIANGKPSGVTTANGLSDTLAGTGGGVYIANGTSSNSTTFTLNGQSYAIYGNLAQFAADDVFANGVDTQLNVPQVKEMDLSEYEFNPEGWFEDYPANDTAYSSGLNLAASDSGIKNGNVFRYRGSEPEERVLINDSYIDSDGNTATKNVNDADVYVCMTLGMPAAVSDTVVIDYGKPVDIHVLVNEQMTIANATLVGIGPWHAPKEGVYGYPVLEDTFVKNKDEVYDVIGVGTAVVTNDGAADPANGVVRYTPDNMSMTKEVTFSYAVRYTNSKDADNKDVYFYYYADVTIIPATIIYYEDDFAEGTSGGIRYGVYNASNKETITDAAAQWMDTVEDYTDSTIQDEDRPGKALVPAIDKDRVYGYDSHYTSCATYSLGNAKKVTVDSSKYATATFTFWGTGFDVISMTSGDTGTIGVSIKTLKDGKETTTNYLVDTYYGYTYTEGGEWVVDKNSSDALYQIPVIKVMGLDYAQHTVTITATYADFFNHKGDSSYDLYLDAIRIYDPANNGVKADGSVNEVVQGAYKDDGECWPTYQELRDLIITKGDFGSIQESGGTKEGALFIDGVDSVGKGKISDYINCGPNNEVYLAPGQAIAFTLGNSDILAKIQLALKSASGNSVNYSIKSSAVSYETINVVATGTDMYQDITNMKGSTVVIKNTSAADSGCILSITNIKTTYTQTPPVTSEAGIVYVDESTGTEALAMLAADEEIQQPEQNVPGSGSEQNPATGDVGVEMMTVLVLVSCVAMMAVLVVPTWRKRFVQ